MRGWEMRTLEQLTQAVLTLTMKEEIYNKNHYIFQIPRRQPFPQNARSVLLKMHHYCQALNSLLACWMNSGPTFITGTSVQLLVWWEDPYEELSKPKANQYNSQIKSQFILFINIFITAANWVYPFFKWFLKLSSLYRIEEGFCLSSFSYCKSSRKLT